MPLTSTNPSISVPHIISYWRSSATTSEGQLEPRHTSKMELLAKIVNRFKQLTIFAKSFTLDV